MTNANTLRRVARSAKPRQIRRGFAAVASAPSRSSSGFTLVELLVVMAVILLVLAVLFPVFASARREARAVYSLSNLRQWGIGNTQFALDNKGVLPWEGFKNANQMPANFASPIWWANVVPPYVGELPYSELSDTSPEGTVPMPPMTGNIFVDPSAQVPSNAPYVGGGRRFFFCYVPNAQLNNTLEQTTGPGPNARIRLSQIPNPAITVLMLEMRTVRDELPPDDPFYSKALNRHRSDWKRFAARHKSGGHMLFADGSARWVDNTMATTNRQGNRDENFPDGDWNKPGILIWDPLGPATDGD